MARGGTAERKKNECMTSWHKDEEETRQRLNGTAHTIMICKSRGDTRGNMRRKLYIKKSTCSTVSTGLMDVPPSISVSSLCP